jgi:GDPmannose 4,6-dehydratase
MERVRMKKALITGVTGQDGSYLADILLDQGYEVHGTHRRVSTGNLQNVEHLRDNVEFHLHRMDLQDPWSIERVVRDVRPDELYHMADQDNVGWSFDVPWLSHDVTARGVALVLGAVLVHAPEARVFVPCSATVFGDAPPPQDEETRFLPQSPYAVGKVSAYYWAEYYRRVHGLHVTTGIMYNHDSPRRTGDYLLHKICRAAALGGSVELGNPYQRVDIGYAREYMEMVAGSLIHYKDPDVYVVGTGDAYAIGDMVSYARKKVETSMVVRWDHPDRPGPEPTLKAGPLKLRKAVGWNPKVSVFGVIDMLVDHYRRSGRCQSSTCGSRS